MFDHSLLHYLKVELCVLALAFLASQWPFWQRTAAALERRILLLSARPALAVFSLIAAAVLLRLTLLPVEPVPVPLFHDEFSYLLGADTFAHGRLTNPTPALPIVFETIHTDMWPTYQSMYMPGTALLLTLGAALHFPWLAVLLVTAGFCGAVYWMTAGWLPRPYALAAGTVAIAVTETMNWWFDNYFCIALPALAGALVLGSVPRIAARCTAASTLPLGIGLVILMMTRPYEGVCLTLPPVLVLVWTLRAAGIRKLLSLAAPPLALLALAFSWLLLYNVRGTGHALLFPYMLNYQAYHITGPFLFSAKKAVPLYHLDMLHKFYTFAELPQFDFMRQHPFLFLARKLEVYYYAFAVGFGSLLTLGVVSLARRYREGLLLAPLLAFCGFAFELVLMAWAPFPQYAAPAAPLFFLLVAFGYRFVRGWGGWRVSGARLARGFVLAELLITANVLFLRVTHHRNPQEPQYITKDRVVVEKEVLAAPGKQLCLVRYTPGHEGWQEWVFNSADIRNERVLWARSLDPATDRAVIAAYPGRRVWLVTPDFAGHLLGPYTADGIYPGRGNLAATEIPGLSRPDRPKS